MPRKTSEKVDRGISIIRSTLLTTYTLFICSHPDYREEIQGQVHNGSFHLKLVSYQCDKREGA